MPADEVTHGADVEESRARTGPRHAAPKRPLFTRFHMPAGKAIATVAMPTAVLMGMGFTSSLALADTNHTSTKSASSSETMSPEDYKKCVEALEKSKDDSSASPSPSASASATDAAKDKETDKGAEENKAEDGENATPSPSATASTSKPDAQDDAVSGTASSPDSGSDDKAQPTASATASPSASATATKSGGLLGGLGDALGDLLTGGKQDAQPSNQATTPSPSATPSADGTKKDLGQAASDTVKDTTKKVTDTVDGTVKGATDAASKAAEDTTGAVKGTVKGTVDDATKKAGDAVDGVTSSPSPSASASTAPADCPAATDAQGGVDNTVPLADDPWYLDASSLTLKGASYKGVVQVRTANGSVKKVLKYVISAGTDIGDLHQTVKDKQAGKTYHVQAAKGSMSKITGGDTVMYTESISGNLLGLLPITFSPDSPPPLDIPLIYFTKVHVVQAAQFGGNLNIPGMHMYTTDGV